MPTTIWDLSQCRASAYSLFPGGLRAILQNGPWIGSWSSILATLARSTGKYHYEIQPHGPTYFTAIYGFQNNTGVDVVTTASQPGQSNYGIGFGDIGNSLDGSDNLGQLTFAGRPAAFEVDLDAMKVWVGINYGTGTTWDPMQARRSTLDPYTATYPMSFPEFTVRTGLGISGNKSIRATSWRWTGKFYWEAQCLTNQNGQVLGIINEIPDIINQAYCPGAFGVTDGGIGWILVSGYGIYFNDVNVNSMAAPVANDFICVAVDFDNRLIWFRKNAGDWNDNPSADPATGTGGVSFSTMDGPYYPCGTMTNDQEGFVVNFGLSPFAQSVPAGFAPWDDGVVRMAWNASDDPLVQFPATGVGGFDISAITGPFFPVGAGNILPLNFTGAFAAADMVLPVSSDFLPWDSGPTPPSTKRITSIIMPM